jgi:hypothetical protein
MGEPEDPLLVSVRSGAAVSMPSMMDTVLNLGLNGTAVERLARRTGDERCARDSYRRFIQMFGDIVLKIDPDKFEAALDDLNKRAWRRGGHMSYHLLPPDSIHRLLRRRLLGNWTSAKSHSRKLKGLRERGYL